MDVNRLRKMETEEPRRIDRKDAAADLGAANPVAAPVPPPAVHGRPPSFLGLSLRLGMVFTVLGVVLLYHGLMGQTTVNPEGEIPQAIFRHYGPKGLLFASGLGGAATLVPGVWMLARFFKNMPRRRR